MIELACLAILLGCLVLQDIGANRFYVCHVVFWIYFGNVVLSLTWVGSFLEGINLYVVQSLYSVLVVVCLKFVISKTAILIIILNIAAVIAHVFGYWIEETTGGTSLYEKSVLFLFVIEVFILMSKRVENGIYRVAGKFCVLCRGVGIHAKNIISSDEGL